MNDERLQCAETALRQVPEDYRKVDAADVAGQECGHSFHRGMHIGWAWGEDERGRSYLDFLSEHRHPGMHAERFFTDGRTEPIRTPASMRPVSSDPAEDAELERRFVEENRAAYADLRDRGLLPAAGENLVSQDINEYLTSGRDRDGEESEISRHGRGEALLGGGWEEVLSEELDKPYWKELLAFVAEERGKYDVFPPPSQTFRAFELTPYDKVKVVILGQDPYPNPGEAHGLAFSVPHGVKKPPSLRNIHQVLESDLSAEGVTAPAHGSLEAWAAEGVLLLNAALTVRAGTKKDRSLHRRWSWEGKGWATFTDSVITAVNNKTDRVVFVLWGKDAQKKVDLIDANRHSVITSSHPSPFSARLGFLASRPFSEANEMLKDRVIDWGRIADEA